MIRACPRCGSTDLSIPKLQDGVVPETDNLSQWVCQTCGLKTIPIEFDSPDDLRTFQQTVQTKAD